MKAVITRDNFKKVLGLVSHVVGTAASLPILSNILLQTEKGRIKISATNLEMGLTCWLGGRVEEEGTVTLPARTINEYVSTILEEQVILNLKQGNLIVSTDTSSASIKTLPSEEFPLIPKLTSAGKISLGAEELRSALQEVIFAAAAPEAQPELSGVYTYLDKNNLYFVSTDRYRLTERTVPVEQEKVEGDFKPIIIPLKTAQEVVRLLASVADSSALITINQGENQVLFNLPDIELVSRLVDGAFPDYKEIIPAEFASTAVLPRFELMQAIKSAGLFASTGRSIKLNFKPSDGQVEVSAASGDIGESVAKISGEVTGQAQESVFNYKYLLDYLGNILDEKVVFKAINDNSPAILTPSGRQNNLYLVMPVKN
ncbi:MAG: DNA polymerase III subunit beta [Candidatus Doudnabacteria bacterium RIFCSPHIGHO2_02_FULL_46_11]|uniref:Beta sliding clamp n=1 Tax=Candidatus Doudnabacteria bacterium RIFCSPHIGHO2_02_FULL_46_11 TaxID=1817832 RepID=A0A1F5P897_9BACT|nr:MAG: DNA polymerase III subunit beta [Candidatus Doudnabacteria bacterium RIFCSPHIGHO2_02_FULL_46_11]